MKTKDYYCSTIVKFGDIWIKSCAVAAKSSLSFLTCSPTQCIVFNISQKKTLGMLGAVTFQDGSDLEPINGQPLNIDFYSVLRVGRRYPNSPIRKRKIIKLLSPISYTVCKYSLISWLQFEMHKDAYIDTEV